MNFINELRQQRWDDHRFYHHNRVNQSLHFVSALCFLSSYILLFISPTIAIMIGWLLAMILRQIGHFYFEPKNYDHVNNASHEKKESIKVGYNLKRKIILLTVWIISPLFLILSPDFFGFFKAHTTLLELTDNISYLWLLVGIGAILFRTIHLFFIMSIRTGLVWFSKILTDPFHDIYIYAKAPGLLAKGNYYDDMSDWYIKAFIKS